MIYICEHCSFLFYRIGEVSECPACEKHIIRPAEREEAEQLLPYLKSQNIRTE